MEIEMKPIKFWCNNNICLCINLGRTWENRSFVLLEVIKRGCDLGGGPTDGKKCIINLPPKGGFLPLTEEDYVEVFKYKFGIRRK
jgi:hypothetical protein